MREYYGARALWAMHPDHLANMLAQHRVESMVPEGLRGLLASGPATAAKPADPVREGATLIVPVSGPLSPKGSYGGTSTEKLTDTILSAANDPKIGAVIMPMSTPGGLVYGTQELGDAIYQARQSKPIIAVASPICFSAGHWIGTQCTAYFASSSGEVGSVGVRGGHVDVSGFEQKIGMVTTLIASSPEKIAGHPYAPLSDEDRAEMQAEIDEMNQAFVAAIARGRGMAAADVPTMHGQGRTFSAAKAAATGVTDGVMTVRDAVAKYGSSRARLALMRRRTAMRGLAAEI